jgi:transposase
MFLPGKGSVYVSQFMRRLRHWYPNVPVWIALDQDRAHPCKSRQTRHVMRDLQLHWISLPKGSPDDNPVENIFSDIQLMILDNSNDPNTKTTQKRISAHLRGRNRRANRLIHVPYLLPNHSHSH